MKVVDHIMKTFGYSWIILSEKILFFNYMTTYRSTWNIKGMQAYSKNGRVG